jgi:hypothetical protein
LQSREDGELSRIFVVFKGIQDDINDEEEETGNGDKEARAATKVLKETCDDIADRVTSGLGVKKRKLAKEPKEPKVKKPKKLQTDKPLPGWNERQMLDGTVTGVKIVDLALDHGPSGECMTTPATGVNSVLAINSLEALACKSLMRRMEREDAAALAQAEAVKPKTLPKAAGLSEEQVEVSMNLWIDLMGKTLDNVLTDSRITDAKDMAIFEDAGVNLLVNIFCAPNSSFEPVVFKATMATLGFTSMSQHKLYLLLNTYRKLATEPFAFALNDNLNL